MSASANDNVHTSLSAQLRTSVFLICSIKEYAKVICPSQRMIASMLWERVILIIKNAGLFFICLVTAFCLSIYGMPLNSLTVGVSDWAYTTFRPLISTPYEADADPTSFFAFVIMLCVYASIMFVIVKLILRTKKS